MRLSVEKSYLRCKRWDSILCPYNYHALMVKTYIRPNSSVFNPDYEEKQKLDVICQNCPKFDLDPSMYT